MTVDWNAILASAPALQDLADAINDRETSSGGQTLIIANDEDITVPATPGTTIVLYTALTAARVVNLPAATSAPMTVIVKDATGAAVEDVATITLVADGTDTFPTGVTSIVKTGPFGSGRVIAFSNDGITSWWETSGVEAVLDALNALLATLGGTDGDGNVYTIEYDSANNQIRVAVVQPNGDYTGVNVLAGTATMFFSPDAGGGDSSVSVSAAGVTINGVTVDPTQPWPGG